MAKHFNNDDQLDLFKQPPPKEPPEPPPFWFSGETYDPDFDDERLSSQLIRVYRLMRDEVWRTLDEIIELTGDRSIAAISARLRDLRKWRFGAHTVNRRPRGARKHGLFEYQLIIRGTEHDE